MQIEIIHSSFNGALLKNWSKERIGRIEFFDLLKSQDMKIQTSKQKVVFAGKSIRHYIVIALLVFDYIWEGLNELNPFCVSFVQIVLAFQILQRLMVGVNNKLFWPKVMLPNFKNSN